MNTTTKPSMEEQSYYLGVDGGGSKTLAIIVNAQGEEVGRGAAGSSNYAAIGLKRAVQNISTAISQAQQALGETIHLRKAWLGLAGVDRPQDSVTLFPHLQPLAPTVNITNDAELALSVLPEAVGVVLISGTGSIALGLNAQGEIMRAGGWGHLLGDEGSGYYLGQQALLAAVRAADGRGPRTLLLDLILRHWKLATPDDIIGKVYSTSRNKATIATLAGCVIQAAEAGDKSAQTIIHHAIDELTLVVRTVRQKMGITDYQPAPLALGGGLLLNQQQFQAQLLTQLNAQLSISNVLYVEQPALSAARAIITMTTLNNWTRIV